jgi:hypothetical protein
MGAWYVLCLGVVSQQDRERRLEEEADLRGKAKRRMLGNIRFIGEQQ